MTTHPAGAGVTGELVPAESPAPVVRPRPEVDHGAQATKTACNGSRSHGYGPPGCPSTSTPATAT